MSQSPRGKMITALPSWWRWNFILIEIAAVWILYCFFCCPPPMIPPASESMYQSQSFYPPVLLIKILNVTERKKTNTHTHTHIYIHIKQSFQRPRIPWSPSTPLSGSCWISRMSNGLLKTQLRCHLRDSILGSWNAIPWDLYAHKDPPLSGAASTISTKKTQI